MSHWTILYEDLTAPESFYFQYQEHINPSSGDTETFEHDYAYCNAMVADALAPCVARSSATMVLIMQGDLNGSLSSTRKDLLDRTKYWES